MVWIELEITTIKDHHRQCSSTMISMISSLWFRFDVGPINVYRNKNQRYQAHCSSGFKLMFNGITLYGTFSNWVHCKYPIGKEKKSIIYCSKMHSTFNVVWTSSATNNLFQSFDLLAARLSPLWPILVTDKHFTYTQQLKPTCVSVWTYVVNELC